MFEDNVDWNHRKIKMIIDFYGPKSFNGKKILELGSGYADILAAFSRLGADCLGVEGREAHIKIANKKYPHLKFLHYDLDKEWPLKHQHFDIILDLGLLCHLDNIEQHLKDVCAATDYLVLETECIDSGDAFKFITIPETKNQEWSLNGKANKPSAAMVERILRECGFEFNRINETKLNTTKYSYDWKERHTGERKINYRRFWFAKRSGLATKPGTSIMRYEGPQPRHVLAPGPAIGPNVPGWVAGIADKTASTGIPVRVENGLLAFCIFGDNENKINIENVKSAVSQLNVLNKVDLFVFLTNYEATDFELLSKELKPKKISNEMTDKDAIYKYFYELYMANKLKEQVEHESKVIYGSVLTAFDLPYGVINQDYLKNNSKIHIGNNLTISDSLMADIYSSAFEYLEEYKNAGIVQDINSIINKHVSEFNLPVFKI